MARGYAIAYRLGLTPWERAGAQAAGQLAMLLDREQAERTAPHPRALDLGCGTGSHTIELARRGWEATGVDNIERAVAKARTRSGSESARFLVGDVTDLSGSGLEPGFDLFFDLGCFHGLNDDQRAAYGAGVSALAAPGATLLMFAFRPGTRPPLPRGADPTDLERVLPGWSLVSAEPADTAVMPKPLRGTAPQWYRLRRSADEGRLVAQDAAEDAVDEGG